MAKQTDVRFEIAYNEGRRGLDHQAAAINEVRTRAATLVTVAAVTLAFLTGVADDRPGGMRPTVWIEVVAFVLLVVVVVAIQLPRNFTLTNNPKTLTQQWIDQRELSVDATYRHLAEFCGENFEANERKLDSMQRLFVVGCSMLGVVVVTGVMDLVSGP